MVEKFKKLPIISKTYLVITCLVGIIFLICPFVQVGSQAVSAFYFPLSLVIGLIQGAIGSSAQAANFDRLISNDGLQVVLILLVFLTWFIILYFVVDALRYFLKGENGLFAVNARRGFIVDMAITVIFFVARLVIIRTIADKIPHYIGSFTDYTPNVSGDYGFDPLFGFYSIFILGIIGYFTPQIVTTFFSKGYDKKVNDVSAKVTTAIGEGKDLIVEKLNKDENSGSKKEAENKLPLIILTGKDNNLEIVELPSTIGSDSTTSEVVIDNPSISRQHLIIDKYDDNYIVSDLNSTNGSILNGNEKLVPEEYYVIMNNDQIQIGDEVYKIRILDSFD